MHHILMLLLLLLTWTAPAWAGEAPVPATGAEVASGTAGEDGLTRSGLAWPVPRFTDNGNGTVSDNLIGLVWLKQANFNSASITPPNTGTANWATARAFCNSLKSGQCGLSDGSKAGQWRLPTVRELQSLLSAKYFSPALPNTAGTQQLTPGNPFSSVQSLSYWSSTSYANASSYAWLVDFVDGNVTGDDKVMTFFVWPVRAGQ
jgi:hypothetical protein